jgi:hypothetical protein
MKALGTRLGIYLPVHLCSHSCSTLRIGKQHDNSTVFAGVTTYGCEKRHVSGSWPEMTDIVQAYQSVSGFSVYPQEFLIIAAGKFVAHAPDFHWTWKFPRPEEILDILTRCSWLFGIFLNACLTFIIFLLGTKTKQNVLPCIEYLVCAWTAIKYYNLDTNKKTFDTLNLQSCLSIVASLTALSNAKQVRIWVQTERSSMLIQLTYILYK